jgi:hypothetical protein
MVDIADDRKSNKGPKFFIVSAWRDRETTLFICLRTNSKTAKFTAPWGMDRMSCAPAPRVRVLAYFHCVNDSTVSGFCPGIFLEDCSIVFIVLAGCIIVCAALRLTAPQIMASQKCRRRAAGAAAAVPPPLWTLSVRSSSLGKSFSSFDGITSLLPPSLPANVRR